MDIRVCDSGTDRRDELVPLTGSDALSGGADDVGGSDRSSRRASALRAWRGLAAAAAEEGGDPSGRTARSEVNVGEQNAAGDSQLPLDTWTHLAVTFDGTSLRLYVNGNLEQTTAVSGAMSGSDGPLRIGGNAVWDEWFDGLIDELRIYSRALSPTEIQTDMNTPIR